MPRTSPKFHYSSMTKKKAGVVLILESMKDRKYWIRLKTTLEHFNLPIDTWAVGNAAYQLFAGSKAFVVYFEDFDSEKLSLDVQNEDTTLMFSRKVEYSTTK